MPNMAINRNPAFGSFVGLRYLQFRGFGQAHRWPGPVILNVRLFITKSHRREKMLYEAHETNASECSAEIPNQRRIVKADRGTVKRITFELLYPNGQLKQIVVENNCEEDYGTFSLIVLDQHGLNNFVLPNADSLQMDAAELSRRWSSIDEGQNAQWRPAMAIINTEGGVRVMCGGHKKGRPPESIIL
jgi:hypothetical protein